MWKEKYLNFQSMFLLHIFPRPFLKSNYEYFYDWKYFMNDKVKCFLVWFGVFLFCFVVNISEVKAQPEIRKHLRLTIVTSSSLVTSIGTVTVKTVPGLWALTTVFTVIRQTPRRKYKVHFHSFFSSLTCHLYLSRKVKSRKEV